MDGQRQAVSAPVLVLLGPPGAGKGTQARLLQERFGLVRLSTRDLPRASVAERTEGGSHARDVMEVGGLVSDRVVLTILSERVDAPDAAGGIILDGSPRTEALDGVLTERGMSVGAALSLTVNDGPMVERVAGRHTGASCGAGCDDSFKPPALPGTCGVCGGSERTRRSGDSAETVAARLESIPQADGASDRALRPQGCSAPRRRHATNR